MRKDGKLLGEEPDAALKVGGCEAIDDELLPPGPGPFVHNRETGATTSLAALAGRDHESEEEPP